MKNIGIYIVTLILIVSGTGLNAEGWKKSLDTDFTLTQNAYSDSWTGGEAGNISWVWNANGVYLMNPGNGEHEFATWDDFLAKWAVLDGMALAVAPM